MTDQTSCPDFKISKHAVEFKIDLTGHCDQQAHDKSVVEEPCSSGWCLKVKHIITFIISISMNISIINIINVNRMISIIIIAIIKEKASYHQVHIVCMFTMKTLVEKDN